MRGTAEHRDSVLDLARMFDVDWMRGQSAGIYTLKNATPDDVIKELHTVFQEEARAKGSFASRPSTGSTPSSR